VSEGLGAPGSLAPSGIAVAEPGRPCCAAWFVEQVNDNTAAVASIEDVAGCTARADAQVRKVLGIAIDETAQLKHGDATARVAPRHAGCTGQERTA
jgi:hypothetical protein